MSVTVQKDAAVNKLALSAVVVLVFFLPLAGSRYFFWFAVTPRALIFQLSALVTFGLVFGPMIAAGRIRTRGDLAHICLGIFLILAGLSTVFSIHVPTAWYGLPGRYEGLVTLSLLAALYISVASLVRRDRDYADLIAKSIVTSAALVAFLSLADLARKGFSPDIITYGPIFNRTLLGLFLVTAFPISLMITRSSRNKKDYFSAAVWPAVSGIIFLSLALTLSRAAWLGALVSIVIVVVLNRHELKQLLSSRIVTVLAVSFVVFLAVILSDSSLSQKLAARMRTAFDVTAGNWPTRIEMWRSSIVVIKERPLLGAGPDTFAYSYPQAATKRFLRHRQNVYQDDIRSKDVHNYFLQLAATVGLPALVFFLGFITIVLGRGLKQAGAVSSDRLLLVGLSASVPGAFATMLLTPSNIIVLPIIWVVLGMIAGLTSRDRPGGLGAFSMKIPAALALALATIFVALLIVTAYFGVVRPVLADYYLNESFSADYFEGRDRINQAISVAPELDILWRQKAEVNRRIYGVNRDPNVLAESVESAKEAVAKNPNNPYNYHHLGRLLEEAAETDKKYRLAEAIEAQQDAVEVFPLYPEAHLALGRLFLKQGERSAAREELNKAGELGKKAEADALLKQ